MLNDFWADAPVISVYTDADALSDGILIDIAFLGIEFNGKVINRITTGADTYFKLQEKELSTAQSDLQFVADNAELDRPGADAWGIFKPRDTFRNVKFWLVGNELGGYTLMLPSEY